MKPRCPSCCQVDGAKSSLGKAQFWWTFTARLEAFTSSPWAAGRANRVVQQPSTMPHAREQCAGMARENRGIVPCRAH
eukprot:scaffold111647_cov30-Phaeocystis_antarctica.AAC.1